ncbi:hypothetical protein IL992_26655 [Microbispora sp. NEAU-D428]|uniref:MmyB family transcriptional regulator n=1 Tax=Microbispora sitophila TaxID=2771537 RepID=UPI001867016C|nr:hypothetical protein [Microbispora sitophila]
MISPCRDLLAYNRAYADLVGGLDDLPEEERNSLWLLFTRPGVRTLLVGRQREARDIFGRFQAAADKNPDDPRTVTLADAPLRPRSSDGPSDAGSSVRSCSTASRSKSASPSASPSALH